MIVCRCSGVNGFSSSQAIRQSETFLVLLVLPVKLNQSISAPKYRAKGIVRKQPNREGHNGNSQNELKSVSVHCRLFRK
jgi:hypothetical protein